MKRTAVLAVVALVFAMINEPAFAVDYVNQKLFDFPDPTKGVRTQTGCANWIKTTSFKCKGLKCRRSEAKICTNPTHLQISLYRRDVRVIASGPRSLDAAAMHVIEGYIAGCLGVASLAAGTPGPQMVASPGVFLAAFKGCISTITLAGAAGAALKTVSLRFDTSQTHLAPI